MGRAQPACGRFSINARGVFLISADDTSKHEWHKLAVQAQLQITREVRLSGERDLTNRLPLHITTAEQAEGLQFNAVFISDSSRFSSRERHLYIAMKRAKDALCLASLKGTDHGAYINNLISACAIYENYSRPRPV